MGSYLDGGLVSEWMHGLGGEEEGETNSCVHCERTRRRVIDDLPVRERVLLLLLSIVSLLRVWF